ncbi:MAG: class I SAM-dependent methyltransferase [bacterium]|nr:class I SAM-dependent methyltransferase [Candidatus Kapabacteria bacterium]
MSEQKDGDVWKSWLLHRRDVDDNRALANDHFKALRDKLLDNAEIEEGNVLLDVGTGTGLISIGALERVGGAGRVLFSDISTDCLEHCRSLTEELEMSDRAEFIEADVEDLAAIPDASVDVVTSRSVIIYVKKKRRAFEEFFRVLKPGGRLSMFEPINSFGFARRDGFFRGYETGPVTDLAERVRAAIEEHQPVVDSPMLDFDERDMLQMVYDVGFSIVQIEYTAGIYTGKRGPQWEFFYSSPPNPLALSLEEAVTKALNEEEAERFVAHMKDAVENQETTARSATMYLIAKKAS